MKNLFCVKDQVVLISWSSRGIGLHLAKGFLEQGAKVAILSENEAELMLAIDDLIEGSNEHLRRCCD